MHKKYEEPVLLSSKFACWLSPYLYWFDFAHPYDPFVLYEWYGLHQGLWFYVYCSLLYVYIFASMQCYIFLPLEDLTVLN